MATTKCRHTAEKKIGHMATTKCRHTAEKKIGHMAKLVDALDLGSSGAIHQSSSLCMPTRFHYIFYFASSGVRIV